MKIYIAGHIDPDLDSIASAIAYAEYLTKSKRYAGAEIIPVRSGEINRETEFILKECDVAIPKSLDSIEITEADRFILIDHNEESQRHQKIDSEKIIELVDHHKVNLNFAFPIQINVLPVGATASIIYSLFAKESLEPSTKVQKLILSAILSDTQGLKSSTTTGLDSEFAHTLAQELKVPIEELIFDIFKAKSDIEGLTPREIAKKDYKIFDFGGKKVFINQIETVEPEKILKMKKELIEILENVKSEEGAGIGYIVITDILKVNSQVIYSNEEEERIVEEAFTAQGEEGLVDIGPRMSRKKDIAPEIEKVLRK